MDDDNDTKENRFEIFWSNSVITMTVGTTSSDELSYLRTNFNRAILRNGEGKTFDIVTDSDLWVCVVAFDGDDPAAAYNSTPGVWRISDQPIPPDRRLDGSQVTFNTQIGSLPVRAATTDSVAASEFSDFQQEGVGYFIKHRMLYFHEADNQRMRLFVRLKASASMALCRGQITAIAGAVVTGKTDYITTSETSYQDLTLEFDLTSGLTAGTVYEVEIAIANSATSTALTYLSQAIYVDIEKNLIVN
jgi:hypothetical protein